MSRAAGPQTRLAQSLEDDQADGRGFDATLQLLADDGVLTGDEGRETVDRNDADIQAWGIDLLAAAEDLLRGRIAESPLNAPVQATLLGLHPHADGTLRGPESTALAEKQLGLLARATAVTDRD